MTGEAHDRLAGLDPVRLAKLAEQSKVRAGEPAARPASERPAPELPAGYVKQAVGLGYFVKSRSDEGAWWLVHGSTCSCPAGRSGTPSCWHRRQVEQFCRQVDAELARPAAPAAPASFFVD